MKEKMKEAKANSSQQLGVYLSEAVYKFWCEEATAKELAMYMYPAKPEELQSLISDYTKSEFILITFRMPKRWASWYKKLSKEEKLAFAKLVEARLREVGAIN
jgi:hypothetical protein